ncbi:MAG: DNA mismatch repair protein MutS, partial [Chloroflexota bacterium]|nr:DNA mismatch repair protein MutS [Chloroflexota bacterium]
KLQDELVRIHEIFQHATGSSIVVMNESFASTTVEDAAFIGKEVLRQVIERDMLAVYVTFIDELASLDEATVSMVSTVVPENPALRTYRLVRRPADGLAYAMAIAEKHGLTYQALKRRMRR